MKPITPKLSHMLDAWAHDFARRALNHAAPSLRVLVWGPSLSVEAANEDHRLLQEKRRNIVAELRELGHVAATSEELIGRASQEAEFEGLEERPIHQLEAHQLQEADFVIVLLGPPGTIAEVAGLLTSRAFARRSAVFFDGEAVAGTYLEAGPLQNLKALGVAHAYDFEDLKACSVAGAAVEFIKDQATSLRGTTQ